MSSDGAARERRKKNKQLKKETGIGKGELQEAERLHSLLFGSLPERLGKEEQLLLDVEAETERKPAWEDEGEAEIRVKIPKQGALKALRKNVDGEEIVSGREYVSRIRAQFTKLNPGTEWAELSFEKKKRKREQRQLDSSDSDEAEAEEDEHVDNILRSNEELVVKGSSRLPENVIDITRMKDANADEPSSAVVKSVQFHKNGQILMTGGFDKKLRFFQIDGKKNTKIQSVFLENFPIQKAQFVPDGSKVVVSSRRKHFVLYDVINGKVEKSRPLAGRDEKSLESFELSPDNKTVAFMGNEGYILLVSLSTMQLVTSLKMNGSVRSLGFTNDGMEMLSCGGDGEIYSWDLRTRRCLYKARDEGCIHNSSLAVSSNNSYFATGSDSGVVNIYGKDEFTSGIKQPLKSLMNLTTTVDTMKFNHDSQLLAICSRMKKNALRLVHLPSCSVFSNWPLLSSSPLQYVHCLDFSPGGGYLAAGNAAGKVQLYRVRHYGQS